MSLLWKNDFRNWINVTNIYGVIRPFYYVAKFYGFAPFQLNKQQLSTQDSVTKPFDWIITLLSLCGYSYIIFILCSWEVDVDNSIDHKIVTISRGILYIITNFMTVVCLITNIIIRKNLQKITNDFHRIDNEVI